MVLVLAVAVVVMGGCVVNCCCNKSKFKAVNVLNFAEEQAKFFAASTENGAIEVTGYSEGVCKLTAEVEVRAADQAKADEYVHKVVVRFERDGDTVKASVDRHEVPKDVYVSVKFNAAVQAATGLELSSVNGSISTQGIAGAVRATTVNGSITTDVQAGDVKVSTVNGSIKLHFAKDSKASSIDGHTVNGSAFVNLPDGFGGSAKLNTVNGSIHSDVELTVKGKLGKSVDAKIGTGTGRLDISTVNGSVRLE
ncbi:MAG: hypothetical protein A2Y07_05500 [Planctomycetes bacterium GWF2_50_10]|nr:MAG: hypothetical protein A2Y07_05500 [Planctomycetes bacterium GWF2_50_10]